MKVLTSEMDRPGDTEGTRGEAAVGFVTLEESRIKTMPLSTGKNQAVHQANHLITSPFQWTYQVYFPMLKAEGSIAQKIGTGQAWNESL